MNHDPVYMDLANFDKAPGKEFFFGTDNLGRDIYSMIWYGGRCSLMIGFLATLISTTIAVVYGTLSGISGMLVDDIMMRFTEILLSIPGILLIIFVQAMIGQQNILAISIIIGVTSWMSIAKMVRTEVKLIRTQEYVLVSKQMGAGFFHVLGKHYFPNFISSIMFMIVMNVRSAIVAESTLSFLGLGLPIEVISWGSMLSLSEKALISNAWWVILIPGVFLVITLMCITNIGNYIRERMNKGESNM
ncbi:MAG: ABC transporter permease [Lachnospiraceae bacterium]|nr:ABC transporter permease [Lachnospiraceae bacterium]